MVFRGPPRTSGMRSGNRYLHALHIRKASYVKYGIYSLRYGGTICSRLANSTAAILATSTWPAWEIVPSNYIGEFSQCEPLARKAG